MQIVLGTYLAKKPISSTNYSWTRYLCSDGALYVTNLLGAGGNQSRGFSPSSFNLAELNVNLVTVCNFSNS